MTQIIFLVSIISILFGVLVFLQPQIIAYLVAIFFILIGLIGISTSWRIKGFFDNINKQ